MKIFYYCRASTGMEGRVPPNSATTVAPLGISIFDPTPELRKDDAEEDEETGLVCENLLAARNILEGNKFSATVGSSPLLSSPQSSSD